VAAALWDGWEILARAVGSDYQLLGAGAEPGDRVACTRVRYADDRGGARDGGAVSAEREPAPGRGEGLRPARERDVRDSHDLGHLDARPGRQRMVQDVRAFAGGCPW